MANKPQVTLTIAGDASQLEKSFGDAGKATDKFSDQVKDSGKSIEGFRESADKAEQRAMGFRDTITGVQDSMSGLGSILKGDLSPQSFLTLGMGLGDLASGFSNLLIPALGSAGAAMKAFSLTLLTSPITWIVLGIVALVAAFILLWNKSEAFRNFFKGMWEGIKTAVGGVVDFFKGLPDKIKTIFEKVGNFIIAPYKFAFNMIADIWNNTVGKISFTIPSWVPVVGGKGFSMPQIPKFHTGGVVPGAPGSETLAILQAGERVTPAGSSSSTVTVTSGGGGLDAFFLNWLQELLRANNLKLVPAS